MTNELVELKIVEKDNQLVVSSIDVAEMVGKEHKNLMRDIRGYVEVLEVSSNLSASNFFAEGTYIDGSNRIKPCYYLTRKGCDMVANKMTGKKGIQFTAVYVEKFYEMENHIKQDAQIKVPQTYKEALLEIVRIEDEKEKLLLKTKKQDEVIEEYKPLAMHTKQVIESETSIDMSKMANLVTKRGYVIGRNRLFEKLRGWKILKKDNTPYQQYMNAGYFEVTQVPNEMGGQVPKTWVTPKGQMYIVNRILKAKEELKTLEELGLL
ncbi:Rha family transcriptional regulator [Peribacillus asahii]|uniref:Rha family transcriptional regulator n=1 Tax=Peribacillus asahii TaxID=228899 RepID=UPI0038267169